MSDLLGYLCKSNLLVLIRDTNLNMIAAQGHGQSSHWLDGQPHNCMILMP